MPYPYDPYLRVTHRYSAQGDKNVEIDVDTQMLDSEGLRRRQEEVTGLYGKHRSDAEEFFEKNGQFSHEEEKQVFLRFVHNWVCDSESHLDPEIRAKFDRIFGSDTDTAFQHLLDYTLAYQNLSFFSKHYQMIKPGSKPDEPLIRDLVSFLDPQGQRIRTFRTYHRSIRYVRPSDFPQGPATDKGKRNDRLKDLYNFLDWLKRDAGFRALALTPIPGTLRTRFRIELPPRASEENVLSLRNLLVRFLQFKGYPAALRKEAT